MSLTQFSAFFNFIGCCAELKLGHFVLFTLAVCMCQPLTCTCYISIVCLSKIKTNYILSLQRSIRCWLSTVSAPYCYLQVHSCHHVSSFYTCTEVAWFSSVITCVYYEDTLHQLLHCQLECLSVFRTVLRSVIIYRNIFFQFLLTAKCKRTILLQK